MADSGRVGGPPDRLRETENVLKRLGYARISPGHGGKAAEPSFWVQEAGVPRRTFPVFLPGSRGGVEDGIDRWVQGNRTTAAERRAIFVVPNDSAAEAAWDKITRVPGSTIENEVSILVVPTGARAEPAPHFHLRLVPPTELLRFATGVVVGLFRRAASSEGSQPVDFEEMLALLKARFGLDVHRSLGVRSDEDALFLLYQLALRDSYAPGDPGANLHVLVLKPTGPAARLPWFAA
jgi:hypothetical protein